ncbi:MAG: hypothetical protein JXR40_08110 [Pontiellaceae bacterium]|nr:hypothetical protein [Pontiellaceae bacterium]
MKLRKSAKLILAVCVSVVTAGHAAVIEKPAVMKEAMVTATISDIHGFINGAGSVAVQIDPTLSGAAIKTVLGSMVGDIGLNGFEAGKGLAVVMLNPESVFAVAEISEDKQEFYSIAAESMDLATKYEGGLLVVCMDPLQLDRFVELAPAVQQQLLSKRSPSLKVTCSPAALTTQYTDIIDSGMTELLNAMSSELGGTEAAPVAKILEAELRVLLSVVKQCEAYELEITPADGSVRIDETCVAVAGSRLEKLLKAPKINQPNSKIQSGLLGGGAIAIDGLMANPDALTTFITDEAMALTKEMDVKEEDISKWLNYVNKWKGLSGGSFAETISFGGKSFIDVRAIEEIKDADKTLAMMNSMEDDMAPIFDFYKKLGIPMTMDFNENARTYKGINIHQIIFDFSEMPEEAQMALEMLKMTNLTMEYAIVDNKMVYTMGGSMNQVIDRVTSSSKAFVPLLARSVFPAGADFYMDFDVVKYVEGIISVMPEEAGMEEALPILQSLRGAAPITMAAYVEDGAAMGSLNIPKSLIAKVVVAIQEIQQMAMAEMEAMMMEDMEAMTMEMDSDW